MPYGPVLDRAGADRRAATPALAPDRMHLAGAIGACQQQLAELLTRLDAGEATPPHEAVGLAKQTVAETLRQLGDTTEPSHSAELTEFEERVWRRLVEAMRADGRRLETTLSADVAALRAAVDGVRDEHVTSVADFRQMAAGLEDRLADTVARVRTGVDEHVTALAAQLEAVRREQASVLADVREAGARQAAARSSEVAGLDRAIARLEAELRRLMGTIDDRIGHQVRRARLGVDEEMAALRTWVEATVAASTGGVWDALGRLVSVPLSLVAALTNVLPRW
jgi:hypothetical protein